MSPEDHNQSLSAFPIAHQRSHLYFLLALPVRKLTHATKREVSRASSDSKTQVKNLMLNSTA